jgi:membrane-associated phospholipid phosphatase
MTDKEILKEPIKNLQQETQKIKAPVKVRNRRLELIKAGLIILTVAFAGLAFFARMTPYFSIDLAITRSIQQINVPGFSQFMYSISYIGFTPQVLLFIAAISGFVYLSGLRWEGIVAVINALSVTAVGLGLKLIVHRPRPGVDLVHVVTHLSDYSFPSGHVLLYTSFFGYIFFVAYVLLKKTLLRYSILTVCAALVLFIGPSRMYLGAHWASDVTGAYIFGLIWLVLTIFFYQYGKKRFKW